MKTEINYYKGKPVITLDYGQQFPFSFGVHKAKLILSSLKEIEQFVIDYDKTAFGQDRPDLGESGAAGLNPAETANSTRKAGSTRTHP